MLNLDDPITVKYRGDMIYKGLADRTILNIYETLSKKGDINLMFPSIISIQNNKTAK